MVFIGTLISLINGCLFFTDDAIDSRIIDNKESISKIRANFKMYQERMSYFIKNKMQRRHMMANTLFLNQTNSSADVEQYMMLTTTNSNSNLKLSLLFSISLGLKKMMASGK